MSEKAAKKKAPAKKAASKKAKPKKEEKPKDEKSETVVEEVKLKPTPQAWVLARHGISMRHRVAKGYSLGELESAEIGLNVAKSWNVPIDIRRRSILEENTEKLKEWYKPARKAASDKPKVEKTEKTEKAKPRKKTAST